MVKLDKGVAWRIVVIVILVITAQFQIMYITRDPVPRPSVPINEKSSQTAQRGLPRWNEKQEDPADFDRPLPLTTGKAECNIEKAQQFLRLPIWSAGHVACSSPDSEVSCFEVCRAMETIQTWEQSHKVGSVFVSVTNEAFGDRMSMLYHGMQIALWTNRSLVVERARFPGFDLPASVQNAASQEFRDLPTDFTFGCANVSGSDNLGFRGASWPQVLYTHPFIAPFLRERFSYHAAYFLGNWLFGHTNPGSNCTTEAPTAVEGWLFQPSDSALRARNFHEKVPRCGVNPESAELVTQDPEAPTGERWKTVRRLASTDSDLRCMLDVLISSGRVVHTFGSRVGFWATAMRGHGGAFVNNIDRICVNQTNSQQGSLWHTYCPVERFPMVYRTNSIFYVCGPNVYDARLYLNYLLW